MLYGSTRERLILAVGTLRVEYLEKGEAPPPPSNALQGDMLRLLEGQAEGP